MILTPVQKLPKNEEDLGKYIVAKGLKKLSKVKKNRPIWSHWLQLITTTATATERTCKRTQHF